METAMKALSNREWMFVRVVAGCLAMACVAMLWSSFSSGYIEFGTRKSHFILEGSKLLIGQFLMLDSAVLAMFLLFYNPHPKGNHQLFNKASKFAGVLWFILFFLGITNGRMVS